MELATATFNETFTRESDLTTCWGLIDLGTSIVQIQVPVTYRYHLQLREQWQLELKSGRLFVHAPVINPSRPPAIHTDRLTTLAVRGWCRGSTGVLLAELQQSLTPTLNLYAGEPDQKNTAWNVLAQYFTDTPTKASEMPEAVEVPVEADLSQHGLPVLIGVLDLVRAGGRIVDFKTAAKTPDPEMALHQNGVQLDCYSVLYREATGKRESGRELHHLVKTKTPKLVITPAEPMLEYQQNRLFRLMENYVEGLAREDFVPAIGMQCLGCEFIHECQKFDGGRHE